MNTVNDLFCKTFMSLDDNDISYDGINCTNKGSGFKIGLDELSDLIKKDINQSCIGRLKITRFAMMINMDNIQFKDNFNMAVIENDRVQINIKIINEYVKSSAKEVVDMDNNCKGVLIFFTFKVLGGTISEFYLEEIHKLDSLPKNAMDFNFTSQNNKFSKLCEEKTDNVIKTQNPSPNEKENEGSSNITNTQNPSPNEKENEGSSNFINAQSLSQHVILLPGQDEFLNPSQIKANNIEDTISPPKNVCAVFLSDDEDPLETPKTRFRNTSTTTTRKRKGSETNAHPTKKKMLSPTMSYQSAGENTDSLKLTDVIYAIELGIISSGTGGVKVEAVKKFLGISHLKLARFLYQIVNYYSIIDDLSVIVRR